jgi:ubiquinone/menaquinone biosynthesis C-methylase UbiE
MTFDQVEIGTVRKFWDSRPCNAFRSPRQPGTPGYFEDIEANKYTVEPHIKAFADYSRWAGQRVLEIGCGLGCDTINFARARAMVTATDLSEVSLDLARRHSIVCGRPVRFVHADAEHLDAYLPPQTFDLVYSFGVIHHSPHPERILEQARRFLGPAGTLKVMVYHRRSWKVLAIVARYAAGRWWKTDEIVARRSEAQTGCPVTYTYTRAEARQLVEQAGFEVTDLHVDHIFPYRIGPYRRHDLVKTWYWRLVPPRLFRRLERTFGWHLMITAVRKDV